MPYVNIKIADEGLTKAQRAALLRGLTLHLQQALDEAPGNMLVVVDQVSTSDWSLQREPLTELRLQVA